jgi:hypothetical protein
MYLLRAHSRPRQLGRSTLRPPAPTGLWLRVCEGVRPRTRFGVLPSLHDSRAPAADTAGRADKARSTLSGMSPTWIWMQVAIVVFVVIGMIIAIVKLA